MPTVKQVLASGRQQANPKRAKVNAWFFKTGKGQYGAGDVFIGLTVPQLRTLARQFRTLRLSEIAQLLKNRVHEFRLLALLIMVKQYASAQTVGERKILFDFYCKNLRHVNNWDLVDLSAPNILGNWLADKPKALLYRLAGSTSLWERRVAIVGTYAFIKHHQFSETCKIAERLLDDPHDLIHKAVGWMLREVGKRDSAVLEKFLRRYALRMPRTMLRYAIERLPEPKRQFYLKQKIS